MPGLKNRLLEDPVKKRHGILRMGQFDSPLLHALVEIDNLPRLFRIEPGLFVERRGKAYSPWSLNALTKLGGLLTVSLLAWLMMGQFFPRAGATQWGMLLLSGFLGFSLGDGFLYASFQALGAKRTLLIFSANPVLTGLFGWIFRPFNRAFTRGSHAYSSGVGRVLGHKTLMFAVYLVLIGATAYMFHRVPGGFVPAQDKQYLIGFAQGFNIISRLMMVWVNTTSVPDADATVNWTYLILTFVSMAVSTYMLWYRGGSATGGAIGFATSPDGIAWTKFDPVITGGSGSWDTTPYHPSVIYDGTIYHMWYSGCNQAEDLCQEGYATSPDGAHWTRRGMVIPQGAPGTWDGQAADHAAVLLVGSTFKMWYSGYNGTNYQIGYASANTLDHSIYLPLVVK